MQSPRTPKTQASYQAFKDERQSSGKPLDYLDLSEETVVREFTHWLIIENRFPYDAMTSVNHMLIPRQEIADYYTASAEERAEYHTIMQQLTAEQYYDALVENFPRSRSLTRHSHVHLVRWQYTTASGKNKIDEPHPGN